MYPFHSESDRDYHAWIGLYISSWSAMEFGLYNLLKVLGALKFLSSPSTGKPIALERKLKQLRGAFHSQAGLLHEGEEFSAIAKYIEEEALFRHDLVHGINAQFYKVEPWYTQMWRPELSNDGKPPESVYPVTEVELRQRYEKVGAAGLALMALSIRIMDMHSPE